MTDVVATNQTIIVVGGGISGMTAALEAAEAGKQVILLEKNPSLGGRVSQLYKYFPKLCFPTCGLEINLRRIKANKNLRVLTQAEVTGIDGASGDYTVSVKLSPRFVNANCTGCGECAKVVESEFPDEYNYGMKSRKGAYLPYNLAYPYQYVLDPAIVGTDEGAKAKAACKYGAIDLEMQEETVELKAGAVVYATGWKPYDANKIQPYGYDRFDNVITNVEFERMLDPFGPTGGKIQRADGSTPKNIAFIQCAGSRDVNHLEHCSRICCMASLKQTTYVQDQLGDEAKSTVYYIDIRAIDRFEDFYAKVQKNENVSFIKSKVANITAGKDGNVILNGNNLEVPGFGSDMRYANEHDLVVLATGMEPSIGDFPVEVVTDNHGFIQQDEANGGIFGCGVSADALDVNRAVQSATAAALRAVQVVNRVAGAEG
ncbi:FAD-dependent oxidoreductase [Endothiovibrio diazotrophicus]